MVALQRAAVHISKLVDMYNDGSPQLKAWGDMLKNTTSPDKLAGNKPEAVGDAGVDQKARSGSNGEAE